VRWPPAAGAPVENVGGAGAWGRPAGPGPVGTGQLSRIARTAPEAGGVAAYATAPERGGVLHPGIPRIGLGDSW
jgi:hypothetical protein